MNDLMERFDIVLLLIGDEAENADNDDQQGGDEILIFWHRNVSFFNLFLVGIPQMSFCLREHILR